MRDLRIIAAAVIAVLASLTAAAQSNPASPTYLALEVYPDKSQPPAYVGVPQNQSFHSGTWFPRFRKLPGWPTDEELQVAIDDESKPTAALATLRRRASSLGFTADSKSLQELEAEFANVRVKPKRDLKIAVEVAMNGVREILWKLSSSSR